MSDETKIVDLGDDYKDVSGLLEDDVSKVVTDEKVSVADKIDIGDKIEIVKPIIPIKPIRAPKFAAMRTMAEYSIPTPVTRKEMYLNVIAGGVSALPTPITREEIYLAKICGMDVTIPIPLTRYEMYLYKLAGGEWDVPAPVTRLEIFLYHNLGFEVETPEPVTREEIYWNGGQPQPTTIEGVPPLTFTAKRTGNLEDYTIYGNTVQSGTSTPDSPIEPEFVGDKTENLFDESITEVGRLSSTGTIDTSQLQSRLTGYIDVTGYSAVVLTQDRLTNESLRNAFVTVGCYDENKEWIANSRKYEYVRYSATKNPISCINTFPAGTKYIRASIVLNNSDDKPSSVHAMLNYGSTALPYEPYGYKMGISSAGQTKNIYLGQVQTTRKIKKLVLTGEETNMFYDGSYTHIGCIIVLPGKMTTEKSGYSTHFAWQQSAYNSRIDGVAFSGSGNMAYFSFSAETVDEYNLSDINSIKSYLAAQYAAGTPVTVWYVLATPEVGIVNEPLCRIGDYADSVDFSQAGVEIPVTAGENTLSVGTTIQPSNMMISYK